jgi:hypothetical protein
LASLNAAACSAAAVAAVVDIIDRFQRVYCSYDKAHNFNAIKQKARKETDN